jgi:hypothetical protein
VQARRPCAILVGMTVPNFKLVQQPDRSFSVSLQTAEGRLRTIDGFDSEHEAQAWVVQTKRMFYEIDPRSRPPSRPDRQP